MMMKHFVVAALAAIALTIPVSGASRTITLDDLPKIAGVGDVAIAPGGSQIAFIVSRADMDGDRWSRTLELYDVATRTTRPLTYMRKALSSPAWSPDGSKLAFLALAGDGDDAAQQIFVMDMRGGDPAAITKSQQGVQQFAWRPDGGAVAYVAADDVPEKKGADKHLDGFVTGDQAYTERSAPTSNHIWLVNADGSSDHRLTSGPWSIPSAQPPSSPGPPLSWSPDGTQIAFTQMPNAFDGDEDLAVISILDVASGKIHQLTSHGKYESAGEFSPDGKSIAYWYPNGGDNAAVNDIFVAPATGGEGTDVTAADVDTNVQRAMWLPDGRLLISGHKNTDAALWVKAIGGAARRVDLGAVQPVQAF